MKTAAALARTSLSWWQLCHVHVMFLMIVKLTFWWLYYWKMWSSKKLLPCWSFLANLVIRVMFFWQVILMILAANAAVGVITETNAEKALEVIFFLFKWMFFVIIWILWLYFWSCALIYFNCRYLNIMQIFMIECFYNFLFYDVASIYQILHFVSLTNL